MQLPAVTATAPGASSSTVDLGPLAWVIGEVQKSLDGAIRSLRRYAREETGTPQLEAGPLRLARQQLHQAVGALQMVGQPGPALVAGAIEFAVQGFTRDPLKCTDAAVQKLERAGFAVVEFLQTLLAGKPASPVALFPQYREVLELAGNERIHPADLWSQSWRWAEVPVPRGTRALAYAPELRSRLDRDVLKVVRQNDEAAASRLHELCVGLAAGALEGHARSFWMLAAGFFEGLALSLIPGDTYAKRAALQMLLQYATLARGQGQVAEMLARDLLFLCAQSAPGSRESAGTLRAVRTAWRIADEQPVDYTNAQFGRFDPLLLAQARKHIESAKEMWSALSGGDMSRVRQAADVFAKLGDSLQKLHPPSLPMAQALTHAVEASMRSGQPPGTEFAMEVATSVLYLEAAFEDLDPHDRQLTARTVQLAGRIDRVREGGQSEALEPWMEELYHRVSDRQTMGTVVDELRGHLGELEKALDEYFRRPTEKGLLRTVPTQLLQMRGVFSVLGLDQAAQTVLRMRQDVDQIVATEGAGSQTDFDSLGNNLGALGFLIDMLGYQPALAKRLFVFDEDTGELKPLMGRHTSDSQAETAAAAPSAGADSAQDTDAQIAARLAALAEPPEERLSSIEEFSRATESWVSRITGPAPLEALPDTEVTELEEDDLQDIFLQEAREVLLSAMGAVEALGADLQDASQLTVLRRAFHTLKGSSRMVGLAEFGNAGWAFEQLFNTWLADQRPATPQLLIATRRALHDFGQWVQAIASGQAASRQAEPFQRVADALGKGEPLPARTPSDAGVLAGAARQIAAETQPTADETPPASRLNDYRTVDFAAPFGIDTPPAHSDFEAAGKPDSPTEWSGLHERGATDERVRPEPAEYDDFVATNFLDFEPSVLPPEAAPPARLAGAEDIDFLSGRSPAAPGERSAPRDFGATVPAGLEPADAADDGRTADDAELDELAAAFRASEPAALSERESPAAPTRPDRSAPPRPDWSTPSQPDWSAPAADAYEATEFAGLEPRTPEPPSVLDADELIAYADTGGVPGGRGFGSEPEPEPEPVDPFLLPATSADALSAADPETPAEVEGHTPASFAGHDTGLAAETATPTDAAAHLVERLDAERPAGVEPQAAEDESAAGSSQADAMVEAGRGIGGQAEAGRGIEAGAGAEAEARAATAGAAGASSAAEAELAAPEFAPAEALADTPAAAGAPPVPDQDRALPASGDPRTIPLSDGDSERERAAAAARSDEAVKAIGPLRIGIALYNVYLNEADEWSRQLATQVGEWAMEPHTQVADATVALAHSLAGSSATVGFQSLSGMARLFEAALQHLHMQGSGTAHDGQVLVAAADELRRLLHQFAAGFLKEPEPATLEALRAVAASPMPAERTDEFDEPEAWSRERARDDAPIAGADAGASAGANAGADAARASDADADADAVHGLEAAADADTTHGSDAAVDGDATHGSAAAAEHSFEALPQDDSKLTSPTDSRPFSGAEAPVQEPAPKVVSRSGEASLDDDGDTIDVADAVDAELFPIFEEEAAELLPQLGGALRHWAEHPREAAPRAAVLRALHTLKGSARLAGAMRLGERAHRMESEIEAIGADYADRAAVEGLLARFDVLQATFDGLRAIDAATQSANLQRAAESAAGPVPMPASTDVQQPPFGAGDAFNDSEFGEVRLDDPLFDAPAESIAVPSPSMLAPLRPASQQAVRIRTQLLDRLVAQAGEVIITRSRLEAELGQLRSSLDDLTGNLDRLRQQLRDVEVQAESQMQSRLAQAKDSQQGFDPLEFDRFTRVQELTRMMAESVNDVATVQRTLQRTVQATEDDLTAQARQTRELQRGLLRTRMVEFEGISERLYRVVRQAAKDSGKSVRLDITGGSIEMDRGVLDRMTPAFEHLLRNAVAHGIESTADRERAGKDPSGLIAIELHHEGNDVSISFRDDGAGLDAGRISERARALGLIEAGQTLTPDEAADMIFRPGFSTADQVSELAGRGIGTDVVRTQVAGIGGRIETRSTPGQGTTFKLVLPLTTALTHVVMMRAGSVSIGVPSSLIELVQRTSAAELEAAYASRTHRFANEDLPFYWAGALLQASSRSGRHSAKANTVVVVRSAAQRIAMHVDEVLGNQEVVVKNLGPQLARLPGMAGITVLASGAVALIYNPVALASVHGEQARLLQGTSASPEVVPASAADAGTDGEQQLVPAAPVVPQMRQIAPQTPLILVVDDSITVRRVTQRLLQREGYRVALAADGLQALERLQQERPAVVLSDIEMPRMDGFDLARNIRADANLIDLPIIMITSRIAEKHREHATTLGVNNYLGKPYSEEELLRLVRMYTSVESIGAVD